MPLQPGDRIERYVIDAPLGQGGMGEVYRAHDERLQRSVALKVLAAGEGDTAPTPARPQSEGATRMLREARSAAALEHPNVVAIYDVGEVHEPESLRGTMYIAMELIKGKTLREAIREGRVGLPTKLRWLTDVARALAAAHDKGLVHRDVKPENVMIREDGVVKVLDFGIAKKAASAQVDPTSSTERFVVPTTAEGTLIGTPMYMAPEQLRGEPLDGRTDQFAWGVVAYEVLAGRLPWAADGGAIMLVSQILSAQPPPFDPSKEVPGNVANVVTRALEKDRGARFATMRELLEALETPASSSQAKSVEFQLPVPPASITQRAGSAPEASGLRRADERRTEPSRAPKEVSRRPAWALAAGLAILLAALFVVGRRMGERKRASVVGAGVDASPVVGCTSNRACSAENGGKAFVCRASDHTCVAVDSEDCKASYEPRDLERDDTVWLGAMFPLKGAQGEQFGTMNMDGVDFARDEIAHAVDSLEGADAEGGQVRHVALVECDDSENATRAAHHLVDDIGVPGILGFRSGEELISLASSLLIPKNVVSVSTITASPLVTRVPQPAIGPRLIWRTSYNFDALGDATAAFVHDVLERRTKTAGATRVMLVRSDSDNAVAFAEHFYRSLIFNNKPALENGHDYAEVVIDKGAAGGTSLVTDQLLRTAPSIVVFLGGPPALEIVQAFETHPGAPGRRPIYVLPNNSTAILDPFIGSDSERRHRVFSVESVSNSTPNARFVIRYNQTRHAHVSRVINPSVSYDAFYVLAYATFALPPATRVTGLDLAERFSRLVGPGKLIEVGPTGVFDALDTLTHGGTLDLAGIAGALDFDLSTGEAPADFALLCPDVDAQGRVNGEDIEPGFDYRAKTQRTEGVLKCP